MRKRILLIAACGALLVSGVLGAYAQGTMVNGPISVQRTIVGTTTSTILSETVTGVSTVLVQPILLEYNVTSATATDTSWTTITTTTTVLTLTCPTPPYC